MSKIKLEHHRQNVLPLPEFLIRMGKYLFFALMLIAASLLLGVLGYHFFGKLSLLDSFHMSSMILTGMGPVAEMTTASAKIFSSIYALYSGVAFLSITAVFFTPIIHRILHILHVENENIIT
jgi:Co/Zn/Cd efflux system component